MTNQEQLEQFLQLMPSPDVSSPEYQWIVENGILLRAFVPYGWIPTQPEFIINKFGTNISLSHGTMSNTKIANIFKALLTKE